MIGERERRSRHHVLRQRRQPFCCRYRRRALCSCGRVWPRSRRWQRAASPHRSMRATGLLDVVQDRSPKAPIFCHGTARQWLWPFLKLYAKASNKQHEAGPGPCPRHIDVAARRLGQSMRAYARVQERLVLEEIEMPPVFIDGVVHRAVGLAHSGHGNRPPVLKSISMSSRFLSASKSAAAPSTRHRSMFSDRSIIADGSILSPRFAMVPSSSRPSRTKP